MAMRSSVALPRPNQGYLGGMTLSRSSATVIAISAGFATDSTNAVGITLAAFTKSTAGAWAAGTGGNGMGNALTVANSTWYHVFAIVNAGLADAYIDTSVTAANKPTGTTAFRRIGSFKTDGSAQIVAFTQVADEFTWTIPVVDINNTSIITASRTTLVLPSVPLGVQIFANFTATLAGSTGAGDAIWFSSLDQTDAGHLSGQNDLVTDVIGQSASGRFLIHTDTSQSLGARAQGNACNLFVVTQGWRDPLGRYT